MAQALALGADDEHGLLVELGLGQRAFSPRSSRP